MKFGLTRTNNSPLRNLSSFRRDINTLFDNFFNLDSTNFFESQWLPDIDLIDDGERILIKADVAGIEEKDLDVQIENNVLTISGQKNEEKKESGEHFLLSERKCGSFTRAISLPDGIKADDITADLKNGVLNIAITKSEKTKSKQVKIDIN